MEDMRATYCSLTALLLTIRRSLCSLDIDE